AFGAAPLIARVPSGGASLDGARAVVTGASRGIGEAVARSLAAAGASVALVARKREPLERLVAELGGRAFAVPCDLGQASGVDGAVGTINAKLGGPPQILVNNAGLFRVAPLHDLAAGDFESMVGVHLVAPFRLIRAFLSAMLAARSGHIVTIGSVADRASWPGNAGYAASKHGVRALHEVLRAETRGSGVRATLVSPGPTDTELWDELDPESRATFPSPAEMLRPDDVARAVLFALLQPPNVNVDELRISRA
ncbi:MAG: SDR family oxidoreductase, partial [Gemmatimonadales bacterium]